MPALTTIYKCADGTEFPVEWETPDDPEFVWKRDTSHWPEAMRPLDAATWKGLLSGRDRAYDEAEFPRSGLFNGFILPKGFAYFKFTELTESEQSEFNNAASRILNQFGNAFEFWQVYCLPRIEETCKALQQSIEVISVLDLAEQFGYAFFLTMICSAANRVARDELVSFLEAEIEGDAESLCLDLLQGHRNATLDADQALWELAQEVRKRPAIRDALVESESPALVVTLSRANEGYKLIPKLDEFLQLYGWRAEGWLASSVTWMERPDIPLEFVRDMAVNEVQSPMDALEQVAQKRLSLVKNIEDQLRPDETKVARFQELMEVTSSYVAVREVRALWQMNAAGSLRAALLRYGNRLTTNSVIADPEDIFFLLPNEIDANLTEDGNSLKSLVEERRRDWEMWRTKQPPVGIGSAYATAVPTESTSEAQPDEMVIRGAGASKGKVTARAKIIHDLSEADKLESGDVLVCVASSPPWTILFTKASAVVTDTGSVLSHPAIASREYGIPCVVATGNATERIRDGMIVTVDGSEGTVRIEG